MPKVHSNWKKVSFSDLDAHDHATVAELVDKLLREKGIDPDCFVYSIDIDYLEVEDEP